MPLYNLVSFKLVPWANKLYYTKKNAPVIKKLQKTLRKYEAQMASITKSYSCAIMTFKQRIQYTQEYIDKMNEEIKMVSE
jgi:hypothetical protein